MQHWWVDETLMFKNIKQSELFQTFDYSLLISYFKCFIFKYVFVYFTMNNSGTMLSLHLILNVESPEEKAE